MNDGYGSRRGRNGTAKVTRRSARNANNGKREGSSDSGLWRGERRSSRLAGSDVMIEEEPARKRARTEDSQTSAQSTEPPVADNIGVANGIRVKTSGAAALKPTEVAMEQVGGKKKSKFWVYAVEPTSEQEKLPSPSLEGDLRRDGGSIMGSDNMDVDVDDDDDWGRNS